MAKQLSMKQQMYQQIANSQVQEVMAQQRQQGIQQLQAEFNAWQTRQNDIAQLQAEFDAWNAQNNPQPAPVKQATVNEVKAESAPKQQIPSLKDFFKPTTASGKDINKEAAQYIQRREKELAAKNSLEDYARRQQEEDELVSQSASKKKELRVGQRPEATDFSSQLAARGVDKSTLRGGEKWNKSVNDTLSMLTSKDAINLSRLPKIEDTEPIEDKASRWLSPDKKLTETEKKLAKEYASSELQKFEYGPNKKPLLESEEDRQHYADMVNLINKTNGFTNFMQGAVEVPYNLAEMVSDGARSVGNQLKGLGSAITDKLGITEGATKRHNEEVAAANAIADQKEASMRQSFKGAQTQNPGTYTVGKIAGQTGMYMLTNPVFDGIAAGAGIESELAKFFINQGAQNVQDLVLDTAPTVKQLMEDGATPEEVKREALNNILWNAAGNAIMGGAGELLKNRAIKNAAQVPGMEDVDNVVRNATEQAEEAAQNIENISKQIPSMPDYVTGGPTGAYDVVKNIEPEPVKEAVEETVKAADDIAENVPELSAETEAQIASDFEEIYNSMEDMRSIVESSGDAKIAEKYTKLQDAVWKYEKLVYQSSDLDEINKAKKAADAARQGFIRAAKKVDPNFKGSLTGTKLGNAEFRRTSTAPTDSALMDELANDWTKTEMENPNRFVEDVSKRDKVMPEEANFGSQKPESIKETFEIPEGPKPPTESPNVKERGQSVHLRGEGKMQMEGVADEVAAEFKDQPDMYKVLKNADTKAKAEQIYKTAEDPLIEFRDMLRQKDPAALPLGHQLAKDLSAEGNYEAAAQIYREMGEELTKAGQFTQAAVINMMKNDPMTAFEYAIREIDNLNQSGAKRFGSKWKNFELTDAEKEAFKNIKPGDEEGIKSLFDQIGERIGKEYPTTFMDKLLEGRKIAMLFNVRTNVRNVLANVPTLGMRWTSDRVEALGQNFAHLINPNIEVTQAVRGSGKEGRKLAKEAFASKRVQALLEDTPGKYEIPDLRNSLTKNKQMYKGTKVEKWLDEVTGGGIQKVNEKLFNKKGVQSGLETIRNATYKMLDLGDSPFVKENFVERLGSYIRAKGIKNIDDIPDEAIQMAWDEAMKATYKDNSWAVQMLSGLKRDIEKIPGVGRPISQAAIPFVQAPGNIAARMIDYSPVKATKGIIDIISGAAKNDVKAVTKGIEEAAKGLTGSGLILLGIGLRNSGLITGTYSEDKDQKAFEKQNGFKEFALHIGDKYFTYDWAQPFSEELILGTLLADAIDKSDQFDSDILRYFGYEDTKAGHIIGGVREGSKGAVNSWFNSSPLQGLADLMKGSYNDRSDVAQNLWDTGVSDFASAFVPATVNAIAKSVDPVMRNTYNPDNTFGSFVDSNVAKIPELSKTLPAKYDTWGREMKYAENKAMATASRFIVPGEYSYDKNDPIDKEINRLFESTNENAVFPPVAKNSVGDKKLNNRQVSAYQKDMGERNRALAEAFINSDSYKKMEDNARVDTLNKLYGASKAITERDKFGKEVSESSTYKKYIEAYDNAGGGKKGIEALLNCETANNIMKESGVTSSSKAGEAIQEAINSGNMTEANKIAKVEQNYNRACQIAGVEEKSSGTRKAWEEGGTTGLKEYVAKQKLFEKYDLDNDSTSRAVYDHYGENGLKDLQSFKEQGIKGSTVVGVYQSAKSEGNVPSIKDFATTYKKMDGYGDSNGNVSQKEFIAYLEKNNISQAEAQNLATIYGDWSTIPVLGKKGWQFKKTK